MIPFGMVHTCIAEHGKLPYSLPISGWQMSAALDETIGRDHARQQGNVPCVPDYRALPEIWLFAWLSSSNEIWRSVYEITDR